MSAAMTGVQTPPRVRVTGLAKRYGDRAAVDGVELDARAGEVVGFVGPNGAGKTTTLRILAGLLRPDAGGGTVLGYDVASQGTQIRRLVGYMPQRLTLYAELTVADNLRFRADVYELPNARRAVEETLSDFGLTDRAGQRADKLSGGWARRLQFAASLIHKPDLLLLDEPTAGLDAESKLEVWRRIARLSWAGATVIVNTHDLIEAEQCSRAALFSDGRVLAFAAPAAIAAAVPIEALLVTGVEPARAGPSFAALPGVIAAQPLGQGLKLVVQDEALDAVRAHATSLSARVETIPHRLEDAAVALSSGAVTALDPQPQFAT
jgi:ABC-2 type transport system ATP-binding protein